MRSHATVTFQPYMLYMTTGQKLQITQILLAVFRNFECVARYTSVIDIEMLGLLSLLAMTSRDGIAVSVQQ